MQRKVVAQDRLEQLASQARAGAQSAKERLASQTVRNQSFIQEEGRDTSRRTQEIDGRLNREIDGRREDVAFLQQQLRTMEGKFNEISMSVQNTISYTTEVKRVLAAVAQSCETSQKGIELETTLREQAVQALTASVHDSIQKAMHGEAPAGDLERKLQAAITEETRVREEAIQEEAKIREQVVQELSTSIHESMQKATTSLQAEFSAMVADIRRVVNAQSHLKNAAHDGHDGSLDSLRELVQQEVEALKQRTSNHWEHYDSMFAKLSQDVDATRNATARASQTLGADVVATRSETARVSQTLVGHTAAIEQIGKVLNSCSDQVAGNANRMTQFIAAGETNPKQSIEVCTALLNARMDKIHQQLDESQASAEAEVSQNRVIFDIHRQMLASLAQRLDSEKDMSAETDKDISRWNEMFDETNLTPQGPSREVSGELPSSPQQMASPQCINAMTPEKEDTAKVFKPVATSPRILTPASPPLTSRLAESASLPVLSRLAAPASPALPSRPIGAEDARQKYLRLVPVQYRKVMIEHATTQPWLDKSWEERLSLAEQLLPSLMGAE